MAFLYGFRYFRISISILRYLFFNALGQFKTFIKKEDRSKDDLINYDSGETR